MRYRRSKREGGTFFFTVVTFNRTRFLTIRSNVDLLRASFKHVIESHPFTIEAFVLLPDHLHCIWTLPKGDSDYSSRWRLIKTRFSRNCEIIEQFPECTSRRHKKEKTIWQRRFWEHQIRNQTDFEKHLEYIHYNPVHHNYVKTPIQWPYSSLHKYVRNGKISAEWAAGPDKDTEMRSYGE